jgi:hypothetical protein
VQPNLDTAGLYLVSAGLGATVGMCVARRGFAVDPLAITVTISAGGLLLALEPRWSSVLGDARSYAVPIGAVGPVNLALAALAGDAVRGASGDPVAR